MNNYILLHLRSHLLTKLVLCVILVVAASLMVSRQAHGQANTATAELYIKTLNDAGGLDRFNNSDAPLNVRLTTALVNHLSTLAGGRFVIRSSKTKVTPQHSGKTRWMVEGELSHTEGGNDSGPYLCVIRLFQIESSHRLMGQWAGYARSYRDVSDNIQNDPRISRNGLIGELSKRIVDILTRSVSRDTSAVLSAFVKAHIQPTSLLTIKVMTEQTGKALSIDKNILVAGDSFRFRVSSAEAGTLYLISLDDRNKPVMLPGVSKQGMPFLTPEHPIIAPDEQKPPLRVDGPLNACDREYVALMRRSVKATANVPWKARTVQPTVLQEVSENDDVAQTPKTSPAVVVLDGCADERIGPIPTDVALSRLLTMAASDPPGTWIAQRFKVHISRRGLSLWELSGLGQHSKKALLVTMLPDKKVLSVMEQFRLRVRSNTSGYLVMITRNADGSVDVLSPMAGDFEAAKVTPEQVLEMPAISEKAFAPDRPGKECIRVLLFQSREDAAAALKVLAERKNDNSEGSVNPASFPREFDVAEVALDVTPIAEK